MSNLLSRDDLNSPFIPLLIAIKRGRSILKISLQNLKWVSLKQDLRNPKQDSAILYQDSTILRQDLQNLV